MRLKVVGVNISFFLPRRVVSRTSGEEFHSLKPTAKPCERSQWLKRESWVDFPEPSMPSTTMSLPRYRFGTKSDINVCYRRPFYPDAATCVLQPAHVGPGFQPAAGFLAGVFRDRRETPRRSPSAFLSCATRYGRMPTCS